MFGQSARQLLICVFLPLVVVAVFWPATRNEFINYDDPTYVLDNPHVKTGFSRQNLRWALTSGYAANWHPLTWVSHMVDCQVFGLRPRGHHLTSILLHAGNTLLAYLALRKLTGSTWRSLFVAGLFGLHPLRVESVAWVAERKDVLSTFFWLATLWAYAAWVKRSATQRASAGWLYFLSLGCLGLGLMSKPMLVSVPFVLLLLDYWPLQRVRTAVPGMLGRLLLEKLPFLILAVAACVITFIAQRRGGSVMDVHRYPMSIRVGNAVLAYAEYLWQFVDPMRLAIFYPHPGTMLPWDRVAISAVILAAITGVAVWQRRARPWIVVGWLWYLGTLVPVIGLVQVGEQAMADRYTYVPMLGMAVAIVWTAQDLVSRWRLPVMICEAGAATVMLTLIVLTRAQIGYWEDSETLFRRALAVTDHNAMAHINLGSALRDRGAKEEAMEQYELALQIHPDAAAAHFNLGMLLDMAGRTDEAGEHFRRAIELKPELPQGYLYLGGVQARQNRMREAEASYRQAISLDADLAEAHFQLGRLDCELARYDDASSEFQKFLRLRPDSADGWNAAGEALAGGGRLGEAWTCFERALQLQPDHASARRNLARLRAAGAAPPEH